MAKLPTTRLQNGLSNRGYVRRGTPLTTIHFKCSLTNVILDVMRNRGWTEVVNDEEEWDFYWCDREWLKENFDKTFFPDHVRICHYRNHFELTRKNLMVKNLKRLRKKYEKEKSKEEASKLDFYPTTFELPSEYHMFLEEFKKGNGSIWIMKPVGRSQGKGIFLFRKLKDIEAWKKGEYQPQGGDVVRETPETYVVSRYIEHPYLVCGRKFDLRVYVMVTCYNPLRVWLYREGFARFANTRFSTSSIADHYVHLTNVAVQKTAPDYDPDNGCKWLISKLRKYMTAKHGISKVETMFRQMDMIFVESLHSVQKTIINDKHCFELYGYDILIDSNLKTWLLEVNAAPSFTASSKEDYDLKSVLLEDTLSIVDMEGRLTGQEKRVGGFDLIWNAGPVNSDENRFDGMHSNNYTYNSFLGCDISDRESQLRSMFKSAASATASNTS